MRTLFDEVEIGKLKVKNRVTMTPMGFSATDSDCGVSQREMDYVVERAKGGTGLIFPPCSIVTSAYETVSCVNLLENFNHSVRLALMIDKVHQYGAKVCVQLSLGFGRVSLIDPFTAPYSSSAIPSFWFKDLICKPLSKENIADMVRKFGYAAFLAKRAGADMVEMHAYGGYLIDQFITPIWNKRTDEYGGSLENRLRIVFELRDAVWANCGKDFPISIKFTPTHGFEGGRTLEEGLELAKIFDESGFSLFHLDYGSYETMNNTVTTVYEEEGNQLFQARALKKAGIKTPILAQGKLGRPAFARKAVEEGVVDFVGLGHTSICEPEWANKVKAGREEDVRPCIGCNECILAESSARPMKCAINTSAGFERDYPIAPLTPKKRVLVIGGGPGGMSAALTAVERGCDVELWEKKPVLGGALLAAGAPDFKVDVANYVKYITKQIEKSPVAVRLGKTATAKEVVAAKPDLVIVATGSGPVVPKIPGVDKACVATANEFLVGGKADRRRYIVVGGGLVGCETALDLAEKGKDVTIVEMLDGLLKTVVHAHHNHVSLTARLAASGIKQMTGTALREIRDGSVIVEKEGKTQELPCDQVILSIGYRSDRSLARELEAAGLQVRNIGDNVAPRKIIDAVHEGFHALRLEA